MRIALCSHWVLDRTEPALLAPMPQSSCLSSPSLAQVLLALEQHCSQLSVGTKFIVWLRGGTRAGMFQGSDSVVPPFIWLFAVSPSHFPYRSNGTGFPYSAEILHRGIIWAVLLKPHNP